MKLLKEISYRYLAAALALFITSLPILYFGIQMLITETVDEELINKKIWVLEKLKSTSPEQIQELNPNISIQPNDKIEKEGIYSKDLLVVADNEIVPHRVLSTTLNFKGKNYHLHIKKSLVETDDLVVSVMLLLVFFLIVLLLSLYYVNKAVAKKIWKPFNQTLDALKNFRVDDANGLQLPQITITEFKTLNNSLLKLAETNTQLFNAQKTFTENAAHELQTPIAVILANIDLLLQQPELNANQASQIENISVASNKIKRLNKALLLLSKIENNAFLKVNAVNLNEVVKEQLSLREDFVLNKALKITFHNEVPFIINMNKDLADILINNLIGNAFRHSVKGGNILIKTRSESLIIANSAADGKLQPEKLFQRFQKQSDNPNSIGLGLEICNQICKISSIQLHYEFKNDSHYFTILKNGN